MKLIKNISIVGFLTFGLAMATQSVAMTAWNEFLPQPLAKSDFMSMKEKARDELTGKEPGTTLSWANEETKLHGTVSLIKVFKIKSHECREIIHEVSFTNGEAIKFDGTLCQNDKGHWEVLPFIFKVED